MSKLYTTDRMHREARTQPARVRLTPALEADRAALGDRVARELFRENEPASAFVRSNAIRRRDGRMTP